MLAIAFPDLDAAEREARLLPDFLAVYADAVAIHSTPFDGVEAVLWRSRPRARAGASSATSRITLPCRWSNSMGWAARCAVLYGGDSLARKKPDPDQLFAAAADCGVAPGDCVYVGDDERDIVAARNAGMRSVAALWGYRLDEDDPLAWQADVLADAPSDLLGAGVLSRHRT
jgi:phosphoglycolate phosphatase